MTSRFIKEVDLLQEVKEVCKETTLATYRKKKAGGYIVNSFFLRDFSFAIKQISFSF